MTALVCFLIAFGVSYLGTLGLLRIPMVRGFIDVPNERSSHEAPKSRIGGVAIVVSFYAALVWLWVSQPETRVFMPLAVGSAMLFLTGLIDDWRGLGVKIKFAMQIVAAITVVSFGVSIDHIYIPAAGSVELGWTGIPITVLFIVGSINFYNFIDGIDGLAAGSAFIAAGFLALISMTLGHSALALVLVAAAGSSIGFLQFNFPPSKLFMGDSGSTFLGFFFAYTAVAANGLTPELPVFIPVLILSSLYLDAGLTLFNRLIKRENIFKAHHTHYYQRLLSLGLNHKQVTLLEYLVLILLGVSAVVYFKAGEYFPVFISACWITLFTLAILKIRGLERGDKLFWEKRTLFVIGLDLVLITVAYLGAYFMRMNFRFTDPEGTAVLRALPIVLIVRSAVFHKLGLYRSVYKYTSTADIVRILKAVTMGSAIILTTVVLLYRFVSFPRTLFIIEFFLLTLLILGSRFSFRLFHEIGKEAHGANVKRYGIVGAGDFGERVARELRNDSTRTTVVSCFIDDAPGKIGMTLHGAPIVGPVDTLEAIVAKYKLDAIVVGIARLDQYRMEQIAGAARAAGVALEGRQSSLKKDPVRPDELFEKLAHGIGRTRACDVGTPSRVFYRGKRVLLTGGGGPSGPALARKLSELGAVVTVQTDSPHDASRFNADLRKDVFVHMGPPVGPEGWKSLFDSARPDVVFYCLALEVPADSYSESFLWHASVSTTVDLMSAVAGSSVSSLVMVSNRGAGAQRTAADAAAVAEAILLNGVLPDTVVPQVIRLPRVLDSGDLLDVFNAWSGAAPGPDTGYDVLEPEAVAVVLDTAASGPGRVIVVPQWSGSFSAVDAESILNGRPGPGRTDQWDRIDRNAGPLYPAEAIAGPPTPGAIRSVAGVAVVTPLCPADETVAAALASDPPDATGDERIRWMEAATASLYRDSASGADTAPEADSTREKERL